MIEEAEDVIYQPEGDSFLVRRSNCQFLVIKRSAIVDAIESGTEGFNLRDAKIAIDLACQKGSRIHQPYEVKSIERRGPRTHFADSGPFNCYWILFQDGPGYGVSFEEIEKKK